MASPFYHGLLVGNRLTGVPLENGPSLDPISADPAGDTLKPCNASSGMNSARRQPISPTGDSHWATDTTAGRISREVMGRDSSNKTVWLRTLPQRTRLRRGPARTGSR